MRLYGKDEIGQTGVSLLLIGDTGVGKTTSILQSAPDPIFFANVEPRDPKLNLGPANREDLRVQFADYETWDDFLDYIAQPEHFVNYNTIVIDSITHLMNVALSRELEDEVFDTSLQKSKDKKQLIASTKLSMEAWGALSSHMTRMSNLLHGYTRQHKVIIYTARILETPRYNTDLSVAAALKGRDYPVNLPGYLDLIGIVENRYRQVEKGDKKVRMRVYPPKVSFGRDNCMCKWTGKIPEKGINNMPLNVGMIVKLAGWVPATEET